MLKKYKGLFDAVFILYSSYSVHRYKDKGQIWPFEHWIRALILICGAHRLLKAILGALFCEVIFVPFIDSYFLPQHIQISSTYPLFPLSLMSISPEVVRQLVSAIDV